MVYRKTVIRFVVLLIVALLCAYVLPLQPLVLPFYSKYIYCPLQSLRNVLFGYIPFSFGDILYFAGGIVLLVWLVRLVKGLRHFHSHRSLLLRSFIRILNVALIIYISFIIGWGENYNKLPLRESWHFDRNFSFRKDSIALVDFDKFLIGKLNETAPLYRPRKIRDINAVSEDNYRRYTDSRVSFFGQAVKPTLCGYFMRRIAIEGYYDPFTGEGQIDKALPSFMLPFVLSHEMAHQAGIAAEGDANLMAYSLCTLSTDVSFNYSGYFNIWMYINTRLYYKDSALANSLAGTLNDLTAAHVDTMEQLEKRYDNDASKYSSYMYDAYLKMQNQKDGIHSYGSVAANAYLLEQRRKVAKETRIHIP